MLRVESKALSPAQCDQALTRAFQEVRGRLLSFLRQRSPDAAIAEDLLQEAFLKALISQRSGRRIYNLTGWLYAAARTALADHYRSNGHSVRTFEENLPEMIDDELALHQELAACMRPFIETLPAPYRDTLLASDIEGVPMTVIARREALTVSAIKSRAVRGRGMLKQKLLACCQVKMANGVVADYHPLSSAACCCEHAERLR